MTDQSSATNLDIIPLSLVKSELNGSALPNQSSSAGLQSATTSNGTAPTRLALTMSSPGGTRTTTKTKTFTAAEKKATAAASTTAQQNEPGKNVRSLRRSNSNASAGDRRTAVAGPSSRRASSGKAQPPPAVPASVGGPLELVRNAISRAPTFTAAVKKATAAAWTTAHQNEPGKKVRSLRRSNSNASAGDHRTAAAGPSSRRASNGKAQPPPAVPASVGGPVELVRNAISRAPAWHGTRGAPARKLSDPAVNRSAACQSSVPSKKRPTPSLTNETESLKSAKRTQNEHGAAAAPSALPKRRGSDGAKLRPMALKTCAKPPLHAVDDRRSLPTSKSTAKDGVDTGVNGRPAESTLSEASKTTAVGGQVTVEEPTLSPRDIFQCDSDQDIFAVSDRRSVEITHDSTNKGQNLELEDVKPVIRHEDAPSTSAAPLSGRGSGTTGTSSSAAGTSTKRSGEQLECVTSVSNPDNLHAFGSSEAQCVEGGDGTHDGSADFSRQGDSTFCSSTNARPKRAAMKQALKALSPRKRGNPARASSTTSPADNSSEWTQLDKEIEAERLRLQNDAALASSSMPPRTTSPVVGEIQTTTNDGTTPNAIAHNDDSGRDSSSTSASRPEEEVDLGVEFQRLREPKRLQRGFAVDRVWVAIVKTLFALVDDFGIEYSPMPVGRRIRRADIELLQQCYNEWTNWDVRGMRRLRVLEGIAKCSQTKEDAISVDASTELDDWVADEQGSKSPHSIYQARRDFYEWLIDRHALGTTQMGTSVPPVLLSFIQQRLQPLLDPANLEMPHAAAGVWTHCSYRRMQLRGFTCSDCQREVPYTQLFDHMRARAERVGSISLPASVVAHVCLDTCTKAPPPASSPSSSKLSRLSFKGDFYAIVRCPYCANDTGFPVHVLPTHLMKQHGGALRMRFHDDLRRQRAASAAADVQTVMTSADGQMPRLGRVLYHCRWCDAHMELLEFVAHLLPPERHLESLCDERVRECDVMCTEKERRDSASIEALASASEGTCWWRYAGALGARQFVGPVGQPIPIYYCNECTGDQLVEQLFEHWLKHTLASRCPAGPLKKELAEAAEAEMTAEEKTAPAHSPSDVVAPQQSSAALPGGPSTTSPAEEEAIVSAPTLLPPANVSASARPNVRVSDSASTSSAPPPTTSTSTGEVVLSSGVCPRVPTVWPPAVPQLLGLPPIGQPMFGFAPPVRQEIAAQPTQQWPPLPPLPPLFIDDASGPRANVAWPVGQMARVAPSASAPRPSTSSYFP